MKRKRVKNASTKATRPSTVQDSHPSGDESRRPVEGVTLHHVIEAGWVHTHGMAAFGLPELEIRNVPDLFVEAACGILRCACHYMKSPGVVVRAGETMAISPITAFRFVRSEPIPGEADHYQSERWQIVGIARPCDMRR